MMYKITLSGSELANIEAELGHTAFCYRRDGLLEEAEEAARLKNVLEEAERKGEVYLTKGGERRDPDPDIIQRRQRAGRTEMSIVSPDWC